MRTAITAASLLLLAIACERRAEPAAARSPDGRWALRADRHDGTLVRLVISKAGGGGAPESLETRDTDVMKWVAGWSRQSDLLFYGSDTGTRIARRFDGTGWIDVPVTDDLCRQLEALFVAKYGRGGTHCTPDR